jgi:hypothetical protein
MYQHAWELDPRSRIIGNNYALQLMKAGKSSEAWRINEAVMEFAPDFPDSLELAMLFSLIDNNCAGVGTYGRRLAQLLNKTKDATDVYVQVCEAPDPSTRADAIATIISWPEMSFSDPDSPSLTYESEFAVALIERGEFEPALELLGRLVASGKAIKYDVDRYRIADTRNGRLFSCDPRAVALFERAELPPPPPQFECK